MSLKINPSHSEFTPCLQNGCSICSPENVPNPTDAKTNAVARRFTAVMERMAAEPESRSATPRMDSPPSSDDEGISP